MSIYVKFRLTRRTIRHAYFLVLGMSIFVVKSYTWLSQNLINLQLDRFLYVSRFHALKHLVPKSHGKPYLNLTGFAVEDPFTQWMLLNLHWTLAGANDKVFSVFKLIKLTRLNCIQVQANLIFIYTEVLHIKILICVMWTQTNGAAIQFYPTCDVHFKSPSKQCPPALLLPVLYEWSGALWVKPLQDFYSFRTKFRFVLIRFPRSGEIDTYSVKRRARKQRKFI